MSPDRENNLTNPSVCATLCSWLRDKFLREGVQYHEEDFKLTVHVHNGVINDMWIGDLDGNWREHFRQM